MIFVLVILIKLTNLNTGFSGMFIGLLTWIGFVALILGPKKDKKMKNYLDTTNILVIVVTFILFAIALFATGFTKDLLLEAGVLLVSVKLF